MPTPDPRDEQVQPYNIFAIGTVAAMAGLLFGFDTGIIAGAQDSIAKTFGLVVAGGADAVPATTRIAHPLSAAEVARIQGFIVQAVPLGAVFGSLMSGWCASRFGRSRSLLLAAGLFVIGTVIAAFAQGVDMLVGGRLVMGLAVGLSAMVAPMYLGEVSPPNVRGTLIFMFQLAITIGLLLAFLAGLGIERWLPFETSWRAMFLVGLVPAAVLALGMLRLPDSPRWMLLKGLNDDAKFVLRRLLGKYDVLQEMEEIRQSAARESGGVGDLFKKPLLALLLVPLFLMVFQQLTGINAIMYYGPQIFADAGFSETAKYSAQAVMGAVNVGVTVLGVWLIDRLGRRPLLYIGFTGIVVCLGAVALLLPEAGATPDTGRTYAIFGLILMFIAFFAVSVGGVPWIMIAELFPNKVRAPGMAIAVVGNWGVDTVVSQTFPMLKVGIGMGATFGLYAVCTLAAIVFTHLFVPETKNRPLEHIETNLYAGKKLRDLGGEAA